MTTNQKPVYTGDIAEQQVDPSQEYSTENQEIDFSSEQHAIWADLYRGVNQPYLMDHICQQYKDGFAWLELDCLLQPAIYCPVSKVIGWRQQVLRMNELFKFCPRCGASSIHQPTRTSSRVLIAVFIFTETPPSRWRQSLWTRLVGFC